MGIFDPFSELFERLSKGEIAFVRAARIRCLSIQRRLSPLAEDPLTIHPSSGRGQRALRPHVRDDRTQDGRSSIRRLRAPSPCYS